MAKQLALWEEDVHLPAEIDSKLSEESNMPVSLKVPSLSYEGKVWAITDGADKIPMIRQNEDGDEVPVPVLRGVVVRSNARRGRTYYEGGYDPKNPGKPACWSADGIKPSESVREPQASKCSKCPMSAKGSRITDQGKESVACSEHRMLAIVPYYQKKFYKKALRLKIAITSDWDGQSPDLKAQNWFAFSNMQEYLKSGGIDHTARVVVKMKFDPGVAFPKIIFQPERRCTPEEMAEVIMPLYESEETIDLLSSEWTPTGPDGTKDDDEDEDAKPVAKKAATKAKPKAKPVVDEDEDEDEAPPPKPKKKPVVDEDDEDEAPAPKPKKKPAPVVEDDDEDEDLKPAPKKKPVVDEDDEDEAPPPKPKKPAPKKAAPVDEDEDEDEAPPPKPKKPAPKKAAPVDEDEDEDEAPPPKPKKAKPPVDDDEDEAPPKKAPAKAGKAVKGLMDDWD